MEPVLQQLSENLFLVEDTCNVYLIREGNAGILIDAGSGIAADLAADIGVTNVEWVLHTHHHRDQCWGTPRLVSSHGVRVAVPEYERYLFESAEEHWQTKRIYDNYNDRNTFFAPGQNIPVDSVLEDYEVFEWRGLRVLTLPAKGHTFGSSAFVCDIDGRRIAFTGDLMSAGGHVYQLHALEYEYGDMAGVLFTLHSLNALDRQKLDLILPSHGASVEDPAAELARLTERLMDVVRLGDMVKAAGLRAMAPELSFMPEARLVRLSEHLLWSGPWASATFYVLLSGQGHALLVDYGHGYWADMHIGRDHEHFETMRFVEHHLDELRDRFGVTDIEVVLATHIHDDHVCGIPYLQRHHNTSCWALEEVAMVIEDPASWASTPALLSKPIHVERRFADGESVVWRGFELTFHHAPGQTEFASVISGRIDDKVVAFTGDNYFLHDVEVGGHIERRPAQTTVLRNSFQLAMHRRCVQVMRAIEPDLICPGHHEVLPCDKTALDNYADFVAIKEQVFRALVGSPPDQHIDLFWARLRPYLASAHPSAEMTYTLMLRSNFEKPVTYAARLLPPPGWTTPSELKSVMLEPGERGELYLTLTAPDMREAARVLVTAEVLIDGRSQGPVAEALITPIAASTY